MRERDLKPIRIGDKKPLPTLEKTRQRSIVKFLNAIPGCLAEVRTQTGYGKKGGADIFGCLKGRHFELEVKQPKKMPTKLQEKRLQEWSECGAVTGRVEDIATTREVFKKHGINI